MILCSWVELQCSLDIFGKAQLVCPIFTFLQLLNRANFIRSRVILLMGVVPPEFYVYYYSSKAKYHI